MRRVKKTTNEQFDLLKAEMAMHPAAARGYGVGAQRAIVDAEWRNIVDKLNALGPPERTMTEWKKVWSDLRLRSIKRLSDEFTPRAKKIKYKTKKNLIQTLCGSESIYASYGDFKDEKCLSSPIDMDDESNKEAEESYENPLAEDEFDNAEKPFCNSSNEGNSYDISSLGEEGTDDMYHNNSNNYNSDCKSPRDVVKTELSSGKNKTHLEQTLSIVQQQMQNQNKIMEHLTKITSNIAEMMENHVTNLEKQNKVIEKQLIATESHNVFLRRQEARRNLLCKCKKNNVKKS